jgi:hypothetical protein
VLAERATESYFSIRIVGSSLPERRRALDEFLARKAQPNGILLFTAPGHAQHSSASELGAKRLPSPDAFNATGRPGCRPA